MKKWVYTVYGYVHEGEDAPKKCPWYGVSASKFKEQVSEGMAWICEHEVGVAQGFPEDITMDSRASSKGECSEVGMYLAVSKVAHREGYPEIGMYWAEAVFEETEHAARFAELLGEVVISSTKKNLEMRVAAESGVTASKFDPVKRAKAPSLDVIRDTVYGMTRDEARHDEVFKGLLNRYFGQILF